MVKTRKYFGTIKPPFRSVQPLKLNKIDCSTHFSTKMAKNFQNDPIMMQCQRARPHYEIKSHSRHDKGIKNAISPEIIFLCENAVLEPPP